MGDGMPVIRRDPKPQPVLVHCCGCSDPRCEGIEDPSAERVEKGSVMTRQPMSEKRAVIESAISTGGRIAFDVPSSTRRYEQVARPLRFVAGSGSRVIVDYGRGPAAESFQPWQNVRAVEDDDADRRGRDAR